MVDCLVMKLGELVRVNRGVATGNAGLFVMSRKLATERHIEAFVRPVISGASEVKAADVIHDHPDRSVVLLATPRDVEAHPALGAYLNGTIPRVGSTGPSPIVATYVGVPHFAANPDELVVLNNLFRVTPRVALRPKELFELVARLNHAARAWKTNVHTNRWTPSEFHVLDV